MHKYTQCQYNIHLLFIKYEFLSLCTMIGGRWKGKFVRLTTAPLRRRLRHRPPVFRCPEMIAPAEASGFGTFALNGPTKKRREKPAVFLHYGGLVPSFLVDWSLPGDPHKLSAFCVFRKGAFHTAKSLAARINNHSTVSPM